MGFIKGLGNLLSGKPVFEPNDGTGSSSGRPIEQTPQTGPKYIPEVVVERVEYYERGNECSLNVHIKNRSNVEIFADRASLMGQTKQINFNLRPGEMREFSDVYKGPILKSDNYNNLDLDYRTKEGDNFRTMHSIEYYSKGDGNYHVKNIRFLPPVKDLYGNN